MKIHVWPNQNPLLSEYALKMKMFPFVFLGLTYEYIMIRPSLLYHYVTFEVLYGCIEVKKALKCSCVLHPFCHLSLQNPSYSSP